MGVVPLANWTCPLPWHLPCVPRLACHPYQKTHPKPTWQPSKWQQPSAQRPAAQQIHHTAISTAKWPIRPPPFALISFQTVASHRQHPPTISIQTPQIRAPNIGLLPCFRNP